MEQVGGLDELKADDPRRANRVVEIAAAWAEIDPVAALGWAGSLDVAEGILASRKIVSVVAKKDPSGSFSMVREAKHLPAPLASAAQFTALDHWSRKDFRAAWDAIDTLDDADFRSEMRQQLLVLNAGSDPSATADAFRSLGPADAESGGFDGAAATLGRELVRQAAAASPGSREDSGAAGDEAPVPVDSALAWAKGLPAGSLRTAALAGLVGEWTLVDPGNASKWVSSYPAGPERDSLIEQMTLMARAPDVSFRWATEAMTDGPAKQRVLSRSATEWLASDPVAARKAIDSSAALTDADRQGIYQSWQEIRPLLESRPSPAVPASEGKTSE